MKDQNDLNINDKFKIIQHINHLFIFFKKVFSKFSIYFNCFNISLPFVI